MNDLGKPVREGGLATLQLFDLYVHLKLPALRGRVQFTGQNEVSGWMLNPEKPTHYLTDGRMMAQILKFEFGVEVESILKTKSGSNAVTGSSLLVNRLSGKVKGTNGGLLPFTNGSKSNAFQLLEGGARLNPSEIATSDKGGYDVAALNKVAAQIAGMRPTILAKVRQLAADPRVRQAYTSGENFEFKQNYDGTAKKSGGLGVESAGNNIEKIITAAWSIPEAKKSRRTPVDNWNIAMAVLGVTTDAEPAPTSRGGGDATREFIDKTLEQARSGMRSLKVLSLIKHVASFDPSKNTNKLDPGRKQVRDMVRQAFREALQEKMGGAALGATGIAVKAQIDGLGLTRDIKVPLTSGEQRDAVAGNNPQIHGIVRSAIMKAAQKGISSVDFFNGIWYSYSKTAMDTLLAGLKITSEGDKFEYSPVARTLMQQSGPSTPSGQSAIQFSGDSNLTPQEYARYAFDAQLLAFIRNGANGDESGTLKLSSGVRRDPANVKRRVGLANESDKDLIALSSAASMPGANLQALQVQKAMVPVLKKVRTGKYNVSALRAIAKMIGANTPEQVFFRDTLQGIIVDHVYLLYAQAAVQNRNRGAAAVVVAAINISAKLGDPLKESTDLGRILDAIQARGDAHYGIMSARCDQTDLLTTSDLKSVSKLTGVSIKPGSNRAAICKTFAAAGSAIRTDRQALSSGRLEPVPRTIGGSKATSKAPTPVAQPMAPMPAPNNFQMFPAGGATMQPASSPSKPAGGLQGQLSTLLGGQSAPGQDYEF